MFNWLRRKEEACSAGEMIQVGKDTDLQSLLREDLLVVFKHSTACPVSWAAHAQVNRFRLKNPDVPVQMLLVIQDRPVSQKLATITGIRHESPQIIFVRNGGVAADLSHGEITEARLTELVGKTPA
jgi:bacillithiol system protein YtxJ